MKSSGCVKVGAASLCLGFVAVAGYSQSSVVELPKRDARQASPTKNPDSTFVSSTHSEFESPVTNSLDSSILAFEQVLSNATWGEIAGSATDKETVQTLIGTIENLGIPVILDESSDLKLETPIEFRASAAVGRMRLASALRLVLEMHNSDFRVTPDALIIYSIDEMAEHLDRVVYNVSALVPKTADGSNVELLQALARVIQNTVEPESWDMEGPSLEPFVRNGQSLVVIVNTYNNHREIRRLFKDVDGLSFAQLNELRSRPRGIRAFPNSAAFGPSP